MNQPDNIPSPECKVIDKPWGREEWLVVGERIVMKRLIVLPGSRLSLQYHEHKEEAWLIVRGRAKVRYGEVLGEVGPGKVVHIAPGTVHRIEAIEQIEILEVSTPELTDVVRVEDDFGRQSSGSSEPGEVL